MINRNEQLNSFITVNFSQLELQKQALVNHIWKEKDTLQITAIWGIINLLDAITDEYQENGKSVTIFPAQ